MAFDKINKVSSVQVDTDVLRRFRLSQSSWAVHFVLNVTQKNWQPMNRASKETISNNLYWQSHQIDKAARAAIKLQQPLCIWLTGLSGAGKSTLANLLEQRLHQLGRHTYVLDGDNVRHGLNSDLGFDAMSRSENVRRVARVAQLMVDAGLIVVVSLISPLRQQREQARALFGPDEFIEVFVDTPLAVCEQRDVKGLYVRARQGVLPQFTGIDSPYETPLAPEIHLRCDLLEPWVCVDRILQSL